LLELLLVTNNEKITIIKRLYNKIVPTDFQNILTTYYKKVANLGKGGVETTLWVDCLQK